MTILIRAAAGFALGAMLLAQTPTEPPRDTLEGKPKWHSSLSARDQEFIRTAIDRGKSEMAAARIALARSGSEQVKQFAQNMIDDFMQSNERFVALAKEKSMILPMSNPAAPPFLVKIADDQFDRTYVQNEISNHQDLIAMFERQVKLATDADARKLAEDTLPVLRKHLQSAQALPPTVQP